MTEPHFQFLTSAYQLHFYLCFKTHCLRQIFTTDQVKTAVGSLVEDVCQRHSYHLLDAQCSSDHVRMLLSLKPEHTVSQAVQMLKGNLSRQISLAFPGLVEGDHPSPLWAKGYFARSSGRVNVDTIRQYVAQQPAHHGYQGAWTTALTYTNPKFYSPAFRLAHCLTILQYQLVLVTKFRTPIFDEQIAQKLFSYSLTVGAKRGFAIDRIGLMPDHVHMIIEVRPDVSIADCALSLVNNIQHWMKKRYWGVLKQTGCWDVWQPSFYASTIGEYSTAQIRKFLTEH